MVSLKEVYHEMSAAPALSLWFVQKMIPRLPGLFMGLLAVTILAAVFAAKPGMQMGGAVMGVLALGVGASYRPLLQIPKITLALAGGVLALIFASSIWAIYPEGALDATGRLALIFVFGLSIIGVFRNMSLPRPHLLALLPITLIIGMAGVLLMLESDLTLQKWWIGDAATRPIYTSILNKSIGILTAFLPAAVVFAHALPLRYARGLTGLLVAGCTILAFVSQAQSALLACVIMLLVLVLPVGRVWFWQALRVLVMGGMLLAPWIAYVMFEPFAEMARQSEILRHAAVAERLEIWFAIAQKILEHPLLGYGYDATRHIPHFSTGRLFYPGDSFLHPHNMALQVWIEFGVLGAVLGTVALGGSLRVMEHAADLRVRKLYLATFLSLLSVSLVGWGMWQTWWIVLLFLVAAATLLAGRVLSREPQSA